MTPERFNGTPWPRWMARDPCDTPRCSCCCCFPGVCRQHLPVGIDERDLTRKMHGGISARGGSEDVFPLSSDCCGCSTVGCRGWLAFCETVANFPGGAPPPRTPRACAPRSTAYELKTLIYLTFDAFYDIFYINRRKSHPENSDETFFFT